VTDLDVQVAGGELPFLDGSARPYFAALIRAGLANLGVEVVPVAVDGALTVRRGDSVISVQPASRLAVACRFGRSELRLSVNPRSFEQHVANARTFGLLDEPLADFRRRHSLRYALARRGGMVFPMRERMPHEPVRHKILDLIGDLWLLGRPLHADVAAVSPNHELNIALARELEAS
jgi:UDP-3-O-acyl-N-acetylglucosamine deacetylase